MENEAEVLDSTNETETTENEVETKVETVDVEALKKENETLKAQKEHWRKKAETKVEAPTQTEGLSQKDVIYLAKADIHENDVDEVTKYAQKMGVSVKEAHEFYKPILNERNEERKTAQATQTKGGSRGSSKTSGDDLINQASIGKLPESDEDINKLAEARMNRKVAERAK